ncbi:MAG: HAD family hydrolase [Bacillota bacterium]
MGFAGYAFVDWDDTIAENIRYFREAEEETSRLIAARTGADLQSVARRGAELDVIVARRIGLVKESFATAWIECYREFCASRAVPVEAGVEAELRRICSWPYEIRQELLPGGPETIQWLHANGFEVTIWTAGVPEVQGRKIRESGLKPWVHREAIVLEKSPERLREYIGERDLSRCFVVGNSAHSDIKPALSVGIPAFHIEVETWAYDHLKVDVSDPNYYRLEQIGELPFLLAKRFRLAV